MQISALGRRRFLAACGAALAAAPVAWARHPIAGDLVPLRRWPTANQRLAPLDVCDGRLLYAGDRQIGLIDPAATALSWTSTHDIQGGARFRPRCADGIVVCAGVEELTAWSVNDGTPLWRRRVELPLGVPCIANGQVLVGAGHELMAIDLFSGAERWRFAAIADTRIAYAPVVAGDSVLVGPSDGRLYAVDATSGRLHWQVDRMREWQYLRQLHIAGDTLVAGSYKERLYGLALSDGTQRWEFSAGNFINSHHVAAGLAYLWSPTGWLYAIDTTEGTLRWRHRTTDYRAAADNWASVLAELTVAEGCLYVLDLASDLHVLDAASGKPINRLHSVKPLAAFVLPLREGCIAAADQRGEVLLFAT